MQTLNSTFRILTGTVFAKHGFAAADLIAQWPEIAGPEFAGLTEPKKILWGHASGDQRRKRGGTLILRTAAGRALELRHEAPRLIERVNRFFGHAAIATVKFEQGSLAPRLPKPRAAAPDPEAARRLDAVLAPVDAAPLQAALRRLGLGLLARRSSPQER